MNIEREGYNAFRPGKGPVDASPYDHGTADAREFYKGWCRASYEYDLEIARENDALGVKVVARPGVVRTKSIFAGAMMALVGFVRGNSIG